MKLISSTPRTRHKHSVGSQRHWVLKRLRSRFTKTQNFVRLAWVLLLIIVATLALSVFHMLRQAMETVTMQ